ncbi:Tfp pilus assembly protein PilF [Fibrobacter sp. UWEL]|nr:Tfp pilus assembly protein PilF [Fibrobacter sp. UWEL]
MCMSYKLVHIVIVIYRKNVKFLIILWGMKSVWNALFLCMAFCLCACVDEDVSRGNVALRIGDYDRAISNYSKALDQDPGHRDARYGLALAYYAVAENHEKLKSPTLEFWERAVQEFEILARVDESGSFNGNYSNSLFYLARATLSKNGRTDVVPLLDRSIQLDSLNFFSMNLKALLLDHRGQTEDARKIFVYILAKEPKFSSAYVNLGNTYWNEGDVESAWDIWSMGHEALPEDRVLAHWTQVAEDSLKVLVQSGKL